MEPEKHSIRRKEDADNLLLSSSTPMTQGILVEEYEAVAATSSLFPFRESTTHVESDAMVDDLVQSLKWSDSFYEKDDSVIAVFDMDYHAIRQTIASKRMMHGLWTTALVLAALFLFFMAGDIVILFYIILLVGPFAFIFKHRAEAGRKALYALLRRHVAISREGVHLDDEARAITSVAAADHTPDRRRHIIPWSQIQGCSVKRAGWCRLGFVPPSPFRVLIRMKTGLQVIPVVDQLVEGLKDPHMFADVVTKLARHYVATADGQGDIFSAATMDVGFDEPQRFKDVV